MKPVVLLISNKDLQCGVHEFGTTIFEAVKVSQHYDFRYSEADDAIEFASLVARHDPAAIIINWHPGALKWGRVAATFVSDRPIIGILHDVTAETLEDLRDEPFDLLLVHEPGLRTGNPYVVAAPRPIPWLHPAYDDPPPLVDGPVRVGSFGFPARDKNFDEVVDIAQEAFDRCIIHFHLPTNTLWPLSESTGRQVAAECLSRARKPGVVVEVSHRFLSRPQLLAELAKNDINVLLYDANRGHGGISAAADVALASGRPMALRRGKMFRNFEGATDTSIFVDDLPLAEILKNGVEPLRPLREAWSARRLMETYEQALDKLLQRHEVRGTARADMLLVGPATEEPDRALENLATAFAAATNLTVRAASVRSGPDLMRQMIETGARLVVVDWRADGFAWLNWSVLARLRLPAVALAGRTEAVPSHLPFAATACYTAATGMGEAARRVAEVLAVGAGGPAMTLEQVAYVAAASVADYERHLRERHNEATRRLQLLWGAVHAQRRNSESWQARAGEIFSALEHMTASRDQSKQQAERVKSSGAPPLSVPVS